MLANYGVNTFDGNPDAQVLGTNPVYVFTGGLVQEGSWLRFMPEDPYQFFDNFDDLNPMPLQPGRTWMEIPRAIDDVVAWEGPDGEVTSNGSGGTDDAEGSDEADADG